MNAQQTDTPRHPIRVVARRTGLTPAVLRAWEKRYGVVVPGRTEGGQRLYSDDDVERLSLLNRAVEEGRNISQVAGLTTDELAGLIREDDAKRRVSEAPEPLAGISAGRVLDRAQSAVDRMDPEELERVLKRSALALPVPTVSDEVIVPLLSRIGTSWESGRLGPAHEHVATVVIRRFLEWMLGTVDVETGSPVLITGTPAGERHELGALLSAISGASEDWKSLFIGPDLPAGEVASAAIRFQAEVVALSCIDPRNSPRLPLEVRSIREQLPPDVHLLLGGPEAVMNQSVLRLDGVEVLTDLASLRQRLRKFRG